jgi:mono/diheme cytochrome c family protein
MKSTIGGTVLAVLWAMGLLAGPVHGQPNGPDAPVDFAREILPVLSDKCFVCHGPDGTDSHILRLDSFAAATADLGGYRAIDPDAPEDSELLARVNSADDPMPPMDAEKQLSAAERQLLARWIQQGGQYATHWSFTAPRKEPPPIPATTTHETMDAFVRARLQANGIDFAPEADLATLARRVSLVLTGLPPEPAQLEALLSDQRHDAYQRFVDRLLASPQYGEHQARYWLDAVRYGDTHGLHLDNRRAIYPYRDWVVHALNKNLPLDQFIVWQLAGDLLPGPRLEQLVATGLVRMNPTTSEGGVIPAEFQAKNNFDRVETLGTVFLGMSLSCARCHNHKYDPIAQAEYYHLLAFFNSTAENALDGNKYEYGPTIQAPSDVAAWDRWNVLESARTKLLATAAGSLDGPSALRHELATQWKQASDQQRLAMVADPQGPFASSELHPRAIDLQRQISEIEATFSPTLIARELPQPRPTHMLRRGEYDLPVGDPLPPETPSVTGTLPEDAPRNRLGLAQWLTSPDNPLVARVLVNRLWQRVFGNGLVRTPEDFGLQGQQPTHPQLLDWLAVELQDCGWDLKHMLRSMVMTCAFRQQSALRQDVDDPENRLLARGPRYRLDAEVIRDMGLWASRLLEPHMGGEGVKPYQPPGLWSALMHPASNTKHYVPDQGSRLYRRSLYVYWKRTSPHPMLTLFDAPSRESSCVRRSRTNTSLQSLGLLNEPQRIEMSRRLARRLLREADDDATRFDLLFTLIACRPPSQTERQACEKLLQAMRTRYQDAEDDALALLAVGEAPRDQELDAVQHAAWTQVAATVLASDVAIVLY